MTSFEQVLVNKGYKKYIMNCKTMTYEPTDKHVISTMVNLDHRYIHPSIEGEICFGLHEKGRPPTLISPRPKIMIRRFKEVDGKQVIKLQDQSRDDAMNFVLGKESPEKILEALFNPDISFNYDLEE